MSKRPRGSVRERSAKVAAGASELLPGQPLKRVSDQPLHDKLCRGPAAVIFFRPATNSATACDFIMRLTGPVGVCLRVSLYTCVCVRTVPGLEPSAFTEKKTEAVTTIKL